MSAGAKCGDCSFLAGLESCVQCLSLLENAERCILLRIGDPPRRGSGEANATEAAVTYVREPKSKKVCSSAASHFHIRQQTRVPRMSREDRLDQTTDMGRQRHFPVRRDPRFRAGVSETTEAQSRRRLQHNGASRYESGGVLMSAKTQSHHHTISETLESLHTCTKTLTLSKTSTQTHLRPSEAVVCRIHRDHRWEERTIDVVSPLVKRIVMKKERHHKSTHQLAW